ncbi:RHOMBOID-like protein 9, chloroplastic isoform X1 [Salvia hispanica]|uniref:RHOMBOID-like protein 9, chloroplastic isoform X1 n=1 Tax=Salvia hispanica TaxID=49212 RepID=UPI002008EF0E|nr:RHOMBOID-like protein 9, chloroplastic isoform X1 [Salvia hispanica]XP_047964384.1 RHOMBOID-like protein 9, chloroplastic isoform X1 [Salvia hispanica]
MASVSGTRSLFCTDNNLLCAKGKGELVSCDAFLPAIKRNRWKCETGTKVDELMLQASLQPRKQEGLLCPSITRSHRMEKYCIVTKATSSSVEHLSSLNSFLEKLHDYTKQPSSRDSKEMSESFGEIDDVKADNGLRSLENYLVKIKEVESETIFNKDTKESVDSSAGKDLGMVGEMSFKNYKGLTLANIEGKEKSCIDASDFYLIGVLVSINIAVFLFEIATPVKSSTFELFSLPTVYGAKINNLILQGEWWRLVTPIFLHSGIIHIAVGSRALFTFGLEVCRKYGSFTFLLLYALGGISGNLFSFLHTPEASVGGTEPVFAIIGAWLIYQFQSKDEISGDAYERMFRNAIITTACICVLSNFGPIDDWAHFGTAFVGISYGFVTSPIVQVKDASTEASQHERITFVRRYSDPRKSLLYFSLFVLLLSCLPLVFEPPVDLI